MKIGTVLFTIHYIIKIFLQFLYHTFFFQLYSFLSLLVVSLSAFIYFDAFRSLPFILVFLLPSLYNMFILSLLVFCSWRFGLIFPRLNSFFFLCFLPTLLPILIPHSFHHLCHHFLQQLLILILFFNSLLQSTTWSESFSQLYPTRYDCFSFNHLIFSLLEFLSLLISLFLPHPD